MIFQSSQQLPNRFSMDNYIVILHVFPNWVVFGIHINHSNGTTQQLSDNNADMEETLTASLSLLVKANIGFDIPIIGCVTCVNELDASGVGGGKGH